MEQLRETLSQEREMAAVKVPVDTKSFKIDELLELLDDIGTAYMTCTHHPLTHIEYGTPVEVNNMVVC